MTPYFDSLLVKVCTHATDFEEAVHKMQRVLREFRIRGVKRISRFWKMLLRTSSLLVVKQRQPLLTIHHNSSSFLANVIAVQKS